MGDFLKQLKKESSFQDNFKNNEVNLSFVEQLESSSGEKIYYITGKDSTNGLDAVYFVLVNMDKEIIFKEMIDRGSDMNLLDYGQIVSSCYGTVPNERVKRIMKEKYNFDV